MTCRVRTIFWLLLSVASGATGFYFGMDKGAQVLGSIATQSDVSDALSQIDSSLVAIEKNNLAYSQDRHGNDLRSGLFQLGINAEHLAYWRCSERDRRIIEEAKSYVAVHPSREDPVTTSALAKALQFCDHR